MEKKNWLGQLGSWLWSCFIPFDRDKVFFFSSLAISAYFARAFVSVAGEPPTNIEKAWPYFIFFLIFFLLPFAKKLDFFQFFSFEAKIAEVQKEVEDTNKKVSNVQDDIRHVISQQQTLSASIQATNNHTSNIHLYTREQVGAAVEQAIGAAPVSIENAQKKEDEDDLPLFVIETMRTASDATYSEQDEETKLDYLSSKSHDQIATETKLRASLHYHRAAIRDELDRLMAPFLSAQSRNRNGRLPTFLLFRKAIRNYPSLHEVNKTFDVFMRISAATFRDRVVPVSHMETADWLGKRLLMVLKKLEVASAPDNPTPPTSAN